MSETTVKVRFWGGDETVGGETHRAWVDRMLRDLEKSSRTEDHLDAAPQDLWIAQLQARGERDEDQMAQSVCPKCGIVGCVCEVGNDTYKGGIVFDTFQPGNDLSFETMKDGRTVFTKPKNMKECAERERWLGKAREMTVKPEEIEEILGDIFSSLDEQGKVRRGRSVSIYERKLAAALMIEQTERAISEQPVSNSASRPLIAQVEQVTCDDCGQPGFRAVKGHSCGVFTRCHQCQETVSPLEFHTCKT